jgi:hypothetical protein
MFLCTAREYEWEREATSTRSRAPAPTTGSRLRGTPTTLEPIEIRIS